MLEYLKLFNCVQTNTYEEKNCSDSFKNKITYKLLTYKPYV